MELMSIQDAALTLLFPLKLIFIIGVTLYITLTGYAISAGAIELPFWAFVVASMKAIVFMALFLESEKITTAAAWAMKVFRALSRIQQPQKKTGS